MQPGQRVVFTPAVGGAWAGSGQPGGRTGFVLDEPSSSVGIATHNNPAPGSSDPFIFTYVGPGTYQATLNWKDAFGNAVSNNISIKHA
jgi:hypothetical protein